MDRKIILSVLAAALFGVIGIMLLMPSRTDDSIVRLPWKVSRDDQGRTQVFGFTLGETTLAEVRRAFGEEGKLNLFARPGERDSYSAEAYFDQLYLNRLRADFVMTLDVPHDQLAAICGRGLRISQLGSGAKKVSLAPEDAAKLANAPIRVITYLPWKPLDAELIEHRFGKPHERITEDESGVIHWLYPDKGMDIARDPGGSVVIQYVKPDAFDALVAPLRVARTGTAAADGPQKKTVLP
jgi:hypothetical protein